MGKYMKKAKASGEAAVMEEPHQSPLGVRTRARTRALQRLQSAGPPAEEGGAAEEGCYLQLRSRRLEKPPLLKPKVESPSPGSKDGSSDHCFGENVLDGEAPARETTPCSLIRNSEDIRTPGSTTRPTNSTTAARRTQNSIRRNVPTSREIEVFFSEPERHQQLTFMAKYNFNVVKEIPLPGRYEWVKVKPDD